VAVRARASYVDVACPVCRLPRSITRRQARRITTGQADGRCRSCRHPQPERPPPDESDYRFWLEWAGVTLNGDTASEYVFAHGLPPALGELAAALFGVTVNGSER